MSKPASLDRSVRAASLFAIPIILIALSSFQSLVLGPTVDRAKVAELERLSHDSPNWHAGLPALTEVLRYRESLRSKEQSHEFVDVHLAGHYNYADFADMADYQRYRLLSEGERKSLQQAIVHPPEFTFEELQEANRKLIAALPVFRRNELQADFSTGLHFLVGSSFQLISLIALLQFLSVTLLATTPGQHLFGFAVVNALGQPAGRVRLTLRLLVAWLPFFFAFLLLYGLQQPTGWPLLLLVPWISGLAVAVIRPACGLHDQLTGCWLVPR